MAPPAPGGSSMVRVVFTANLQRHVECPPEEVPGGTLREVLVASGDTVGAGDVLAIIDTNS